MNVSPNRPSAQDVLEWFAMERGDQPGVLAQYLREYPEYAEELVDLSAEIFRVESSADRELSDSDKARIESAQEILRGSVGTRDSDVLSDLSADKLRELAHHLNVPRQVTQALAERTVKPESVSLLVISAMALVLGASADHVRRSLAQPQRRYARSFKADEKPAMQVEKIPFDRVLREAGVEEERIQELVSETD